jgi:hypothetical protein
LSKNVSIWSAINLIDFRELKGFKPNTELQNFSSSKLSSPSETDSLSTNFLSQYLKNEKGISKFESLRIVITNFLIFESPPSEEHNQTYTLRNNFERWLSTNHNQQLPGSQLYHRFQSSAVCFATSLYRHDPIHPIKCAAVLLLLQFFLSLSLSFSSQRTENQPTSAPHKFYR